MANLGLNNLGHLVRKRFEQVTGDPTALAAMNRAVSGAIQAARATDTASRCLVAGCAETPIRSHVIPEGFLKHLDVQGAPLTPTYNDHRVGGVAPMGKVGTPTFPGYCGTEGAEHDQKLFPWEGSLRFPEDDDTAVRRQLMRTADARIHEVGLRQDLLERVAAATDPDLSGLDLGALSEGELSRWRDAVKVFRVASQEARSLRADLTLVAARLRDPEKFDTGDQARCIALRTRTEPLASLIDAAWVPRSLSNITGDRVPIVVCVLADPDKTHLLIGTTEEGGGILAGIDRAIQTAGDLALYIAHWVQWGSQCWYVSQRYWDMLDQDLRDQIERDLNLVPHVQAAIYGSSGHLRTPILRPGNGWV